MQAVVHCVEETRSGISMMQEWKITNKDRNAEVTADSNSRRDVNRKAEHDQQNALTWRSVGMRERWVAILVAATAQYTQGAVVKGHPLVVRRPVSAAVADY